MGVVAGRRLCRRALGVLARSRALLRDGQAADSLYREAIERLERSRIVVHLARAHLLYGEWLRREHRRLDAREQLRTAYEMLGHIGAEAFAERARRELLATGETVRKRTVETRDVLTAQEAQIARLAGDGLSNPEIGAELFISRRTVEWHLRKVFTKLDVGSAKSSPERWPSSDGRCPPGRQSRRHRRWRAPCRIPTGQRPTDHQCGDGASDRRDRRWTGRQWAMSTTARRHAGPPEGTERSTMKIVIIGGTGLIGSKLVKKLTEHGHETLPASPDLGVTRSRARAWRKSSGLRRWSPDGWCPAPTGPANPPGNRDDPDRARFRHGRGAGHTRPGRSGDRPGPPSCPPLPNAHPSCPPTGARSTTKTTRGPPSETHGIGAGRARD
jgi:DNA-binding CsgD family transcriptional regulator